MSKSFYIKLYPLSLLYSVNSSRHKIIHQYSNQINGTILQFILFYFNCLDIKIRLSLKKTKKTNINLSSFIAKVYLQVIIKISE
jgi:hypothetical protein